VPAGPFSIARWRASTWGAGAGVFVLAALPLLAQRGVPATAGGPPAPLAGDVARGKALLESGKCLDCHRIGETGSRMGPDLSEIGKLRSLESLQRALVAPDDEVLPENRLVRVVTRDGTTVTGRLLNQDAFSVQLMTSDERLRSFLRSSLREQTILQQGLMPPVDTRWTPQQIADLVSYLGSLKGAEK
jgi:putative heme-binding domain-containing protein